MGPGNQGIQERNQPPALPDSTQVAQMVDELAESLDLSADQKEQVSVLYFAHFAEAQAEMSDNSGDRDDHRDKMAALRREFEGDVKALLTDEQQAEFDELAKERRPQRGRNPR